MTLKALMRAGQERKCVVWLSGRHMPIAFLNSMQFWRVAQMLPRLKLYKPKQKAQHVSKN